MWMDVADSSVICNRNCSENEHSFLNYSLKMFMLSHEIFIWLRKILFITFGNLHSQGSDLIITSLKSGLFRNKSSFCIRQKDIIITFVLATWNSSRLTHSRIVRWLIVYISDIIQFSFSLLGTELSQSKKLMVHKEINLMVH